MFLIGPFHAYLVDAYKRKYVCMFSFATMVAATAGYAFVTNITELILLSTVQGLAFGIATTAGITLAIDITNATLRSAGNVSFSWMARLGMIIGIVLSGSADPTATISPTITNWDTRYVLMPMRVTTRTCGTGWRGSVRATPICWPRPVSRSKNITARMSVNFFARPSTRWNVIGIRCPEPGTAPRRSWRCPKETTRPTSGRVLRLRCIPSQRGRYGLLHRVPV